MNVSFKRISAIFLKELQDIRSNMNQLFLYVIPVILIFVYKKLIPSNQMPKGFALSVCLLMLVVMAGIMIPAMMLAEEKEKKTLDVLMLSPATPLEVFAGKGLLTFLSVLLFTFVLMLIDGESWAFTGIILISTALATVLCTLLGMLVGLLAQNQMATGVVGFPFFILLMLPPMFGVMGVQSMKTISVGIPTYYFIDILKASLSNGKGFTSTLPSLGILAGSIVIGFVALLLVYRRKGLTN